MTKMHFKVLILEIRCPFLDRFTKILYLQKMKFTTDLFPMSYAAFQMIDDNEFPLKGINVLQFFLKQSPAIKDQKRRVVFFYHERLLGLT